MEWQKTRFPGCEAKTLLFDRKTGLMTALMKFAPGAVLPDHEHVNIEQTYVLEGSWSTRKVRPRASNARPANTSGASRAAATSPGVREGGLMLAIFQVPNKFFEADGRVVDAAGEDWDADLGPHQEGLRSAIPARADGQNKRLPWRRPGVSRGRLSLCSGLPGYRAPKLPVAGDPMSLSNASDRISADVDRRAMVVRLTPPLYAATLFVSALLLFSIQPMFAKMVLPKLGGAPAVWSVAMVFFQTVLLAGYAYAHLLNRLLPPRWAAVFHLALLGVTAIMLPIAIAPGWGTPPSEGTALWLFGLFAVSIGLPFFTLSASAPLLQSWFAASGHRQAGNPYVLYAASNLGSFAALFAYPVIVEPFLTLKTQTVGVVDRFCAAGHAPEPGRGVDVARAACRRGSGRGC